MWPALALIAVAALIALQWWWRRKFLLTQEGNRRQLTQIQEEHLKSAAQIEVQQRTLFDSMVEGLLLLDERDRIRLANRAFMALFDLQIDVRGKTILEALRLHELSELVAQLGGADEPGHELKLSRPVDRWLQVNAAGILDSKGQRQGAILVFHDLTRLKTLERTREEFVANVSHELRTPLSLIKGAVETLLDGASANPEAAARFLQIINRNAERLRVLMDDLLTISEMESGRIKLNLQSLALHPLVEKVFDDFRARADNKRVTLKNNAPEVSVRADSDRLEQVLANLVDNAIKYGRNEGSVTVGARLMAGNQIEAFVRDDGPGIPGEALPRIFERFYRVDKARSRQEGGTGLGLSIVKHIIQTHGGRTWATSQPGKGTSFFFTLPQA